MAVVVKSVGWLTVLIHLETLLLPQLLPPLHHLLNVLPQEGLVRCKGVLDVALELATKEINVLR